MQIHKVVAGSVLAAGLGVAGLLGAGAASAEGAGSDNTTANGGTAIGSNPSASDTMGFGVVNHMQGDGTRVSTEGVAGGDYNGDHNGIGWSRSDSSLPSPSTFAGTNRVVQPGIGDPNTLAYQQHDTNGVFSPGQTTKLNK